jgi:ABC-type branched-subunit amino acid transport system substrate-binding protein
MRTRYLRPVRIGAVGGALLLLAAACGSDNSGSSTATTKAPAATASTASTAAPATSGTTSTSAAAAPKPTTGFDGTTIKLGMLAALSGPVAAPIGIPLANGNRVFFEALNAKGGIAGKYKVSLVEADNKYDVAETVKQYGATKDSVAAYVQVLGTPTMQALLQSVNEDKILVGPATLDAQWQSEKYLLPIEAPYQIQAINALSYWVQQNGKTKPVCSMVVDSSYGQAGEQGLEYAAQQLGVPIAVKQTFKSGDQDFTAQINAFKSGNCAMIWLTAVPSDTSPILGRAAQAQLAAQWIAQSPTWVSAFVASPLAPYLQSNFLLAGSGPQWGDTSVPGMAQMLNDVKASTVAAGQKPDGYFTFGYVEAWAMAQVLEQAVKNGDLSRAGLVKAVSDLGTLKFGGLAPDQKVGDPGVRQAPRSTTLFKVTPASVATDGGLQPAVKDLESDQAKSYTFPSS